VEIETIAFCHELSDDEKVRHIQDVLTRGTLQRTLVQEQLAHFTEQSNTSEDAVYYDILEAKSIRLQNRATEIVKQIDLEGDDEALLAAIQHYKAKEGVITHTAPMAFLDPDEQQVVVEGKFRVSLYKTLLFIKIAEAIKAGALNVKNSYRHRSLDDYMIPRPKWEANRDDYLKRAGLTAAADWNNSLQTWATRLDQQYHETNTRILADQNPHTRFEKNGKWHLTTPKVEKPPRLPLLEIFPEKRYISLLEVLSTVNRFSHFLDGFEHWQGKYARPKPPDRTFYAGILGFGCFIGLPKMATISTRISESELENAVNWYFSLETIQAANDHILQFMDQLELPEVYRRQPGKLHTSSDGQKFEVSVESLMATYSYKYFGQNQGVSAYNFLDERNFGFHSNVVSASEREAHYVIDGLMHNDVVKSDLHSTDTDGYTEILFGVLHLLGFEFAPRIKNVPGQRLYGFHKRKGYELRGYNLLPDGYINTELIAEQGDEILRFVATIKLKEATASQLFKRLNSYARQHPLYSALKEYGKIPKSDFLLRYVDDVSFRQAIEKQMNKIENANKFSRAIAFGNNQSFLYGDKIEQEMAEGCRRLIKNAIICWNYLYLTQRIAEAESEERRHELLEAVKNGSVAAWQHVNLHGEYDFSDEKLQDSVGLHLPPELDILGLHTETEADLGVATH
jgi:TnpA family transposase